MHSWRFDTFSAPDTGPFSPRFRTRLPAPCGTDPPPDFLGTTGVFPRPVCVKQTLRLLLPWPSCCFDSFKALHPYRIRCLWRTRNPIPSCTSLFRALPRHPIGHRYRRLSLLPFQRLQGVIPLWQCSRCCHLNLTLLSFSLQGFLPVQSCSRTSAGLPSCRYPCGTGSKVLTLPEQMGLL